MNPAEPRLDRFGDLGRRLISGVALSAIALVDLWLGGYWVGGLAALAALLMLWEYHRMVTGNDSLAAPSLWILCVAGAGAAVATAAIGLVSGVFALAGGVVALAVKARTRSLWLVAGLVYVGFAMCYLIVLRENSVDGLPTVLWLILVVIAADVGAYFIGRAVGGPRLWKAVSPGKTWSGALGGLAVAGLVGTMFGLVTGRPADEAAWLSLGVAVASQCGDLLESAVKRRFGVKDASRLIPGHGGVLDRLDGLMGGLWFFAACDLIGVLGR